MTNQQHNLYGDNIAGDKYQYIIHSIQTRELMNVISSIMENICYRELDKANDKLNLLRGIGSLENDVTLLINALDIKVKLVNSTTGLTNKSELISLIQKKSISEDVKKVVISILIDLESKISKEIALERFRRLESTDIYINEVFYEHLASKEEINEIINKSSILDLSEQELTGLVRGALRVEEFESAYKLANELLLHYKSNNSETLSLLTETVFLNFRNKNTRYISITIEDKKNLDNLIEKLTDKLTKENDNRNIISLVALIDTTELLNERVFNLAIENIDKIDALYPEFSKNIKPSKTLDYSYYKSLLSLESLDLNQFAALDIAIKEKKIRIQDLSKWMESGGSFIAGDEYSNAFIDLYFRAKACSANSKEEVQKLDKLATRFIEIDSQKFLDLNLNLLLNICERFLNLDLPLQAFNYLAPFFQEEVWLSAHYECYLTALLHSEKFSLFLKKIEYLKESDKNHSAFLIEAQVYVRLKEYEKSINATRKSIELFRNNPFSWYLLLHISRKNGLSIEELKNIVFEIPEEIFKTFHNSILPLVNEIASYIDIDFADKVLVDWFAKEPNKVASTLTNIHLSSLHNRTALSNNPYEPIHCCDGIEYSDGFQNYQRLLVRDVDSEHPLLLDIESPLGIILNSLRKGETTDNYTMIDRLPPFVAAYRYALKIRHDGNDGTDVFRMLTLPSREDDLVPYLEKFLKQYTSIDRLNSDVLENPHIPLIMRGHFTDKNNPVRGAITHLSSSNSNKFIGLFANGEEQPSKVIIDVYTAVYLSLLGFSSYIENLKLEIVICHITKNVLESWVMDVSRDDYMSMGVTERGLFRITSEDIRKHSSFFINELKVLLSYAKVENLKPIDTPEILIKIRDLIDDSAYSTFQLSIANGIPLLSIDHIISGFFHDYGYPVANTNSLMARFLTVLEYKDRKRTIELNLHSGTPVSILYNDILQLSYSKKHEDTFLVFKFIEKHQKSIISNQNSISFLTEIVRNTTLTAFADGTIVDSITFKRPSYDGFAQHIFNASCQIAISIPFRETTEQRLASFIHNLVDIKLMLPRYFKLISHLASQFAIGHFMDIDACNLALDELRGKTKAT